MNLPLACISSKLCILSFTGFVQVQRNFMPYGVILILWSAGMKKKMKFFSLQTLLSGRDARCLPLNPSASSCALMYVLVIDFQRLGLSSEVWLFDWRKYLQRTQKRKRWISTTHTKTGVWRGQREEIQGLFATKRHRMKEWAELEKKRRRMWESEFIQRFGKSGVFTGKMMSTRLCGFLLVDFVFLLFLTCQVKSLEFCKWFSC